VTLRGSSVTLYVFEYFSNLGTALSKQVYLEERRLRHFTEQQERLAGLFVTLERAEKLVELGRFEESVPLLKELKRENLRPVSERSVPKSALRAVAPGGAHSLMHRPPSQLRGLQGPIESPSKGSLFGGRSGYVLR